LADQVTQQIVSELELELENKNLEYIHEEKQLNLLNEKYSVLKASDKTLNVLQKNEMVEKSEIIQKD
jgi:hypothetical protein